MVFSIFMVLFVWLYSRFFCIGLSGKSLGYHVTKEDAEMTLRIYKHLHSDEFTNKEDTGIPITQSQIDGFLIAMQGRKRQRMKTGSVKKAGKKYIATGPSPKYKYLGVHTTREEAEYALAEYKRANPHEFD